MKINRRWNKFGIGLALGFLLPLTGFLLYFYIQFTKYHIDVSLKNTVLLVALPQMISICIIPNFIIFYLFLNKEYWYATRGVIIASVLYTMLVLVIKIFAPN